jgi:hypothetical protein
MGASMARWARATILLAALGAAAAQDVDDTAGRLWVEFQGLKGDKSWKAADRRQDILRGLGRLNGDKARQVLLRVASTSRTGDERVLAVLSLGKIADLETWQALQKALERKPDPVVAEAYAEALTGVVQPEVLRWLGSEALATKQPEVLRACLEALAAVQVPEAVPTLVALYGTSTDVAILHETVRALGKVGGPGARATLLAAATNPDWRVRVAAAEVLPLSAAGDEKMLAATKGLLLDQEPPVRRAAAKGAADAKLEALVPDLIELLQQDPRLRTREVARQALKTITGRDYGHDANAWRQWLRAQASDKETLGDPRITVAQYYGMALLSDRVLFIIDVSGSMSWPWRKDPKRIDVARKELERVLATLKPPCLFNMIVFSTRVHAWQRSEALADPKNVEAAIAWAENRVRDPDGDTYTYDALDEAFERNPEFDTIWLLSDGAPSDGAFFSPEGILECVKCWNRYRGAVISTIGLTLEDLDRGRPNLAEDLPLMKSFVQRLASSTGGECKLILRPPP